MVSSALSHVSLDALQDWAEDADGVFGDAVASIEAEERRQG